MLEIPKLSTSSIYSSRINTTPIFSPSTVASIGSGCLGQEYLKNKLRTAYGDQRKYLTLPGNLSHSIQGRVMHQMVVFRSKESTCTLSEFFDQAEAIHKNEVDNLIRNWPMFLGAPKLDYRKLTSLYSAYQDSKSSVQSSDNVIVVREKTLDCSTSLGLKGAIDYFYIKDKDALIVDYKFGNVLDDEDRVKEAYQIQLNLYSLMLKDKYPQVESVTLQILDEKHNCYDVPQLETSSLVQKIADLQKQLLETPTDEEAKLFTPQDFCQSCNFAHICKYRKFSTPEPKDYFHFKGIVQPSDGGTVILESQELHTTLKLQLNFSRSDLLDAIHQLVGSTLFLSNLQLITRTEQEWVANLSSNTVVCQIED